VTRSSRFEDKKHNPKYTKKQSSKSRVHRKIVFRRYRRFAAAFYSSSVCASDRLLTHARTHCARPVDISISARRRPISARRYKERVDDCDAPRRLSGELENQSNRQLSGRTAPPLYRLCRRRIGQSKKGLGACQYRLCKS